MHACTMCGWYDCVFFFLGIEPPQWNAIWWHTYTTAPLIVRLKVVDSYRCLCCTLYYTLKLSSLHFAVVAAIFTVFFLSLLLSCAAKSRVTYLYRRPIIVAAIFFSFQLYSFFAYKFLLAALSIITL